MQRDFSIGNVINTTLSVIKVSPSIVSPGSKINISADVFDSSGVKWVRVLISKGGEDVRTIFHVRS